MSEITIDEVAKWLEERRQNAMRLAESKHGEDKAGWLEDALFFQRAVDLVVEHGGDLDGGESGTQSPSSISVAGVLTDDDRVTAMLMAKDAAALLRLSEPAYHWVLRLLEDLKRSERERDLARSQTSRLNLLVDTLEKSRAQLERDVREINHAIDELTPESLQASRNFAAAKNAERAAAICPHCGPDCTPGAAHNARAEDGVIWKGQVQ